MEQQHPSRLPVVSLISGIVGLISCCTPPVQMLFGAAACITAYLSKQGKPLRGAALAGMILGVFSIISSLLIFFYYMAAMQILGDPANAAIVREIMQQYQAILNGFQPIP